MKRISAILLLLALFLALSSCKGDPSIIQLDKNSETSINPAKDHMESTAAVTKDAVYWEEGDAIYRRTSDGGKAKIADGNLLGAVGEYAYYTADGKVWAYNQTPMELLSAGSTCYIAGTGKQEVLLSNDGVLYRLDRQDPAAKTAYKVEPFSGYATLHAGALYHFRDNALCKTDPVSGATENLADLGYIGTAIPSFYWLDDRMFFYYGYTVYAYGENGLQTVASFKEGTTCTFANDLAYIIDQDLRLVDLQSGSTIQTEENITSFSATEWGVAYQKENTLFITQGEKNIQFPLPEKIGASGLCLPNENAVLIKGESDYFLAYPAEGNWVFDQL